MMVKWTERVGHSIFNRTPILGLIEAGIHRKQLRRWTRMRAGGMPHLIKQATIRSYASSYGTRTLVETGTCLGEMVHAMRDDFDTIISIELDDWRYRNARRRFAGYPHIEIKHGDNGQNLPSIVANIDGPALFWLDAHYSGGATPRGSQDTPVQAELATILRHAHRGHVILIDDAGYFVGKDGYPTLEEVAQLVRRNCSGYGVEVKCDMIQICPTCHTL